MEEEDIRDRLSLYISDFEKYFQKYYIKKAERGDAVWVNQETGEVRFKEPTPEEIHQQMKDHLEAEKRKEEKRKRKSEELRNRPEKIKKLYKKIASKVHPDRGGSDEMFQRVNDAYTKNDLIELLNKAGEYGIEYEVDDKDEEVLQKNLSDIEKEIHRMKDTIAWIWGTGDKDARMFVVNRVKQETGLDIDEDDLPDDLRPPKKDDQKLLDSKE